MKKGSYSALILISGFCNAQNLAPNGNFESYQLCPSSVTIAGSVNDWSSFGGTCDYFNSCAAQSSMASVPANMPGYQFAHSGNGYCGFLVGNVGNPAYREMLGAQLTQPLITGSTYYVSFYVSLADGSGYHLPMDKQGALFSTVPYTDLSPPPVLNFAHVYNDSIVSDTSGWTCFAGSFIADSAYSYVSFGNFFDQQHTDVLSNWQPFFESYYYIDDIIISTDPLSCPSTVGMNEEMNNETAVFIENPFHDQLTVRLKNNQPAEIILFDVSSKKLLQQKFSSAVTVNTTHLTKGTYLYEVRNGKGPDNYQNIKKGKIVKD